MRIAAGIVRAARAVDSFQTCANVDVLRMREQPHDPHEHAELILTKHARKNAQLERTQTLREHNLERDNELPARAALVSHHGKPEPVVLLFETVEDHLSMRDGQPLGAKTQDSE